MSLNKLLDDNIKTSYDDNNKRIDKLDSKYKEINRDLTKEVNTNTTDISKIKLNIDTNNSNITKSLNNFDNNLKANDTLQYSKQN